MDFIHHNLSMKKMKYSRRLLAATAIIAGLGMGGFGISSTFAAEPSQQDMMSRLVEAIAERFQVRASDVQAVFDEQRQQIEAQFAQHGEEKLAQAVEDGKLTQEQADVISAKHLEMKASMEGFISMTPEERQTAMKAHREEMKQWAEAEGIPTGYFQPNFHKEAPHGKDFPRRMMRERFHQSDR